MSASVPPASQPPAPAATHMTYAKLSSGVGAVPLPAVGREEEQPIRFHVAYAIGADRDEAFGTGGDVDERPASEQPLVADGLPPKAILREPDHGVVEAVAVPNPDRDEPRVGGGDRFEPITGERRRNLEILVPGERPDLR